MIEVLEVTPELINEAFSRYKAKHPEHVEGSNGVGLTVELGSWRRFWEVCK